VAIVGVLFLVVRLTPGPATERPQPLSGVATLPLLTTPVATNAPQASPVTAASDLAAYPGARTGDEVAGSSGEVDLDGIVVSATSWSSKAIGGGQTALCAAVSLHNVSGSEVSYSEAYWTLQSPSGDVKGTVPIFAGSTDLGYGQLIAGGTASGQVCFADPGLTGQYVTSFQPSPVGGARAVWLIRR
jgi:hypothetical protein